jgi:aminoglycoside phosphotransferase
MNIGALPNEIENHINGMTCTLSENGCSSARVYRCYDAEKSYYLKINDADDTSRRERDVLYWLDGRLPVPKVICSHEFEGLLYLLMTEMGGRMAYDEDSDSVREPIGDTVKSLADGLLRLQSVNITDCPFDNTLDNKLGAALRNIENGLVDMTDWEKGNRFNSPLDLYNWLINNKPDEDICFVHGDYCPDNIFINDAGLAGFIDTGNGGLADRYQDIALCVRSLGFEPSDREREFNEKYISALFAHLGIDPDWEKVRYYILLDELF